MESIDLGITHKYPSPQAVEKPDTKPRTEWPTLYIGKPLDIDTGKRKFMIEAEVIGIRRNPSNKDSGSTELCVYSICPCDEEDEEKGDGGDKLNRTMEKIASKKAKKGD